MAEVAFSQHLSKWLKSKKPKTLEGLVEKRTADLRAALARLGASIKRN